MIKLQDGPGSGPGGEFIASYLDGSNSFATFCLEKNEYIAFNQPLKVAGVTSGAINGGVSGGNPDPISFDTAYLYTQFRAHALSGYNYGGGAAEATSANSLQNAFWYLEGEIFDISGDTQAQNWITEASNAGWANTGHVAVLNLLKTNATGQWVNAQDQLTLVPEPETYAMMLAGLGLMGFVARRRKQNLAA